MVEDKFKKVTKKEVLQDNTENSERESKVNNIRYILQVEQIMKLKR